MAVPLTILTALNDVYDEASAEAIPNGRGNRASSRRVRVGANDFKVVLTMAPDGSFQVRVVLRSGDSGM